MCSSEELNTILRIFIRGRVSINSDVFSIKNLIDLMVSSRQTYGFETHYYDIKGECTNREFDHNSMNRSFD